MAESPRREDLSPYWQDTIADLEARVDELCRGLERARQRTRTMRAKVRALEAGNAPHRAALQRLDGGILPGDGPIPRRLQLAFAAASPRALSQLQRRILGYVAHPGRGVRGVGASTKDLAAKFEVSTRTMQAALKGLADRGIVRSVPDRSVKTKRRLIIAIPREAVSPVPDPSDGGTAR